jgi:hypothetical protein
MCDIVFMDVLRLHWHRFRPSSKFWSCCRVCSCLYLAAKFFPDDINGAKQLLKDHAVCLCDDDNDLEMALACGHAYIPEISSSSMKNVMNRYPEHFTQTGGEGVDLSGTDASEAALLLVLKKLEMENQKIVTNEEGVSSYKGI